MTVALTGVWSGMAAEGEKPQAPSGPRAEQVKERVERIAKELNLSEEQKGKIRSVLQGQADKVRELRADQNLTPEQRREKMMAIRQENQKEMKGILNEEQFKKWTEMRNQAREGRGPAAPGGQGERPRGPRRAQGTPPPEKSE